MNIPENREQLEELVMRYLYDDFDSAERAAFEQALASNPLLQEILEQEQSLERAIPRGTAVHIDEERLQDSRRQMRRNLQKQVANRSAIAEFLVTLMRKPSLVALQSVALAASYVLGVLIASPSDGEVNPVAGIISPLALVGEQEMLDGVVTLKEMESGTQEKLTPEQLAERLS